LQRVKPVEPSPSSYLAAVRQAFVNQATNDRNDAEAIGEAVSRPSRRLVAAKTADQQTEGIILKQREMLVSQRTQTINA